MSIKAVEAALNVEGLPPGEKIVLVGLANHAGPGGCWVGIATLAKYAGLKHRQVQRIVGRLVERGLVSVDRNSGGTANTRADRRPNRYKLHLDGVSSGTPRDSNGVTPSTPREDLDGVSPSTSTGCTPGPNGVSPSTPEPSVNHLKNRDPQSSDMIRQRAALLEEAGKMYTDKQIGRGVPVRSPRAFAAARVKELEEQSGDVIDGLVARIERCRTAGQTTDLEAHAAVLVDGVSARQHLSDVNPDPARCTSDCRRCEGTSMYEPDPGAGYASCPGPLAAVGAA